MPDGNPVNQTPKKSKKIRNPVIDKCIKKDFESILSDHKFYKREAELFLETLDCEAELFSFHCFDPRGAM
jgi:hypothetical protein